MPRTAPGTTMERLSEPSKSFGRIADFILETTYDDIPQEVTAFAALLVLDLLGGCASAARMDAGRIAPRPCRKALARFTRRWRGAHAL